ncbi:MAG TPA: metalloregulator ArsR/SmtB family transcription factor [Verrucomicrobiae bacterium]|nr:metalloregulator ArsR/SmtB family transcription factor [Verrucomicrobiae bacterium]
MSTPEAAQPAKSDPPLIPLETFLAALANPVRWRILRALSAGEPLPVMEIARRVGRPDDTTSKHLVILKAAGLVKQGWGRLYRIEPAYQPVPGQPVLEFGHALLRLDKGE